jgi:hypothetical protein
MCMLNHPVHVWCVGWQQDAELAHARYTCWPTATTLLVTSLGLVPDPTAFMTMAVMEVAVMDCFCRVQGRQPQPPETTRDHGHLNLSPRGAPPRLPRCTDMVEHSFPSSPPSEAGNQYSGCPKQQARNRPLIWPGPTCWWPTF